MQNSKTGNISQENVVQNQNDVQNWLNENNVSIINSHDEELLNESETIEKSLDNTCADTTDNNNIISQNTEYLENGSININQNKRTIEQLFGDIDDILSENIPDYQGTVAKKRKLNYEENSLALIEKIVNLRKQFKERTNPLFIKSYSSDNCNFQKENISFVIPKYSCISVKLRDGRDLYVRCHSEEYEKEELKKLMCNTNLIGIMGSQFKDTWAEALEIVSVA